MRENVANNRPIVPLSCAYQASHGGRFVFSGDPLVSCRHKKAPPVRAGLGSVAGSHPCWVDNGRFSAKFPNRVFAHGTP